MPVEHSFFEEQDDQDENDSRVNGSNSLDDGRCHNEVSRLSLQSDGSVLT